MRIGSLSPCAPSCASLLQKQTASREEASLAHERAALQHAQELEARVAAFDAKETTTLRVGGGGALRARWGWE